MIESFANLPLARYEIRLVACEDAICYPILGSTLRGAFGSALKDVSCTVAHRNCAGCILHSACSYTNIFEPQIAKNSPRPFTFQIPVPPLNPDLSVEDSLRLRIKTGAALSFGLTVFGHDAQSRLPYIISAVEQMARKGLGMPRKEFRLHDVVRDGVKLFDAKNPSIIHHKRGQTTLADICKNRVIDLDVLDRITIRFLSPIWLRENGNLVEKPSFFHLVKFLLKRLKNIAAFYSTNAIDIDERKLLDDSREIKVIRENLWRHDFDFYSNRRHRREAHSGLLGEMTITGKNLGSFLPLLAAGELLHIGSKTSFGLGRYQIL